MRGWAGLIVAALLAGCGTPPAVSGNRAELVNDMSANDMSDDLMPTNAQQAAAQPEDPHPFSDPNSPSWDDTRNPKVMHAYFWSPKRPKSNCTPGMFFPGGRVPIAFYHQIMPEQKKFEECVAKEAAAMGASYLRLALPSDYPKVGTCFTPRITKIYDANAVDFDNGMIQYNHDAFAQLAHSRVGDRVRICVSSIPEECPANDLRGIQYLTTNLRTHERWELGPDGHGCWGH